MKQRLYIAATDRAEKAKAVAVSTGEVVQRGYTRALTYATVGVGSLLMASASFAQGFNSSLAPLLTALLPVLVVILAIWQGPKLLKRLTTMMAH